MLIWVIEHVEWWIKDRRAARKSKLKQKYDGPCQPNPRIYVISKNALNFLGDYTAIIFETLFCNLLTKPVQKNRANPSLTYRESIVSS